MWWWAVVGIAFAKEPGKTKGAPPAPVVTVETAKGPVQVPHVLAFRRPGGSVWTVTFSADPFTCDEVRQEGYPAGSFAQIDMGPSLLADGTEPWKVLGTYLAHGGGSGASSEDGPAITWSDGTASWTEAIPLPLDARIVPGTVKPVDCGVVPIVSDPPVFEPSTTATWRVAGKPLVVGGARIRSDGALELSTDGASCAWSGGADVSLVLSADGSSVELGGGRMPLLFPATPEPGPVAWTAPPKTGERAQVKLDARFRIEGGYAIELGGMVDAFDCREE
jgi:hypothetical protein